MATKTDIELKIVDSVDTSHTEAEVLTDSAANPDAFYVGRGYLAHNGEKVIEGINPNGSYPNMTVGNAQKAKEAESATHADTATDLSGRVEATPEVFTYRPSAGDKSIKDDNAYIRRVKGNSVVWNQFIKNGDFATTTDWSPYQSANVSLNWGDGLTVTSNYAGTGGDPISVKQAIAQPFILGHKYFVHFEFSTSNSSLTPLLECYNALYSNEKKLDYVQSGNHYYSINNVKATRTTDCYLKALGTKAVGDTWTFKNVMIIDLTQMFGAGNEPTTVEEFRALYPDSYYPYNAGELRNLVCSGIKTVGFNQWDGKVEVGFINDTTGNVNANQNYLHTDFIRVIPNQEYYINTEQTNGRWGAWYDANKNYVAGILNYDRVCTAPSNAAYIRLTIKTADSGNPSTFCFNLHHTGWRAGDYEPYKEVTHSLPLSQITNGEPLRYVYNSFAGEQYDEINETEYIKRIGVVDLGTLDWSWDEANSVFKTYGLVGNGNAYSFFCSKYTTTNYGFSDMADKTIRSTRENLAVLGIKDSSFGPDASAFKASLAGVMLNYELAEPVVTPIETPIDFNYYVEDFGTEEALLAEDSAPFSADIVYQFNATDQIRNNTRNIQKLQKSAFTPSGTSAQYIRGDGSYGDRVELSQSTPINDGEYEMPDEGDYDMQFTLSPSYYAKSPRELDDTTTIAVFVTAPEDSNYLAEYWFEFAVGESLPNIEYYQPNNSDAVFRIDGDMMTYAVNILHLISSDGGETFFGEIKNYVL